MKKIVCEICDGKDFVKQDGMYVCQHCGTKYTVEEAKKLMVETPDSSEKTNTSESVSNPVSDNKPNPDEIQKKKRRKKIIILTSVIAGIIVLLLVGTFVGLKVFKEYKKTEVINNSANEITNNTWKSISSDTTITVKEDGGTYGKYNITSWKYKAPVLDITYQEPSTLFNEPSSQTITLNLSWYNDDILQLTTAGDKGECFVKESDYNSVKELIKQSENAAAQANKDKNGEYSKDELMKIANDSNTKVCDVSDIMNDTANNKANAKQKYCDKVYVIHGVILNIESDHVVIMDSSGSRSSYQIKAYLPSEELIKLETFQIVDIVGHFTDEIVEGTMTIEDWGDTLPTTEYKMDKAYLVKDRFEVEGKLFGFNADYEAYNFLVPPTSKTASLLYFRDGKTSGANSSSSDTITVDTKIFYKDRSVFKYEDAVIAE